MNFEGNPNVPFSYLIEVASSEIEQTQSALPEALRQALSGIAVVLEEFPSLEHQFQGVEPDQLGLFEGADTADPSSPHTPKIVLWLGNLWEMSNARVTPYREEVRITYLHELGHYLGFDEEDLLERGLD